MYLPSNEWKRTAVASGFTPARSSNIESFTPVHRTSGTRHPVTHWKSRVMCVAGIAVRSRYEIVNGRSTSPVIRSRYASCERCGNPPVIV